MPVLAARYPGLFTGHASVRTYLLTLNDIIHPEVRKLYPGADVPDFDYETTPDGDLVVVYHSRRRLCALAEGFIEGAADYYGETVTISQPRCALRGDKDCALVCRID